jgi:polysaccharide deacetylase 2 family uncharacterized protein YibQ
MSEDLPEDLPIPPWRETILARYPRNVKMAATVGLLAVLILPPAWIHGHMHHHVEGQEIQAADNTQMSDQNAPTVAGKMVESDVSAAALNDQDDRTIKMTPAPDNRITEDNAEGSLPRISENGLRPWQVYARPFNTADKRPRIALIITGLAMSRTITDQAINQLPPTVTLALASQGPVVGAWGARARQDGHEILLMVPMEPFDYPRSDPGPETLLTTLPNSDNLARLYSVLRKATGYVGVISVHGSRFTTDSTKFAPILDAVRARGLMIVDARAAPHSVVTDMARNDGVPVATVTQRIDGDLSPDAIAGALNDLEKTARLNGRAIAIAGPSPVLVSQIQAWAKSLPQRGIALAPISAMVQ